MGRSTTDQVPSGVDVDHDLIRQADGHGDRFTNADLYGQIHKSQRRIPWWLVVMMVIVILLAIVLNAPFLTGQGGSHPLANLAGGATGGMLDTGMLMALIYVGGGFGVIFWFTCGRKDS